MKKLVTTRQLIMIIIVCIVTLKFLYLPSLLAKDFGRDGYLYALLVMAVDFLVLTIFVVLKTKYPDMTFYEILTNVFGVAIAKIITFLFFIYFMLKCWGLFVSNFSYLNENLYTSLTFIIFSIPILVVVFYMATFGVNALVRVCEIMAPIIIFGVAISLVSGVSHADYSNLLPVFENGFFKDLPKILNYTFWFGDYSIFIILLGNVKKEKMQNTKIFVACLITTLVVVFFIATSYAVFNYSSINHTNSISDLLQVLPAPNDIGSFDWILVLIWDIAMFLTFCFNILGAFYCFRQTFCNNYQKIVLACLLAVVFVANLFTKFDILSSINYVRMPVFYGFLIAVQYVLPVLIFLFSFKLKKKEIKSNAEILVEK